MKNLKISILTILLTSISAFAQIEDKWLLNEYEEIEIINENDIKIDAEQYVLTEEYTPAILDPKDKYKLNQDIIYLPTQVTKTLRLDGDKDASFDREIKMKYLKPESTEFDFMMTLNGLKVSTENNIKINKIVNKNNILHTIVLNKIMSDGDYTVHLSSGEKIDLEITDFEIIK